MFIPLTVKNKCISKYLSNLYVLPTAWQEDKTNKKLLLSSKATTFQDQRISSQAKRIYVIQRDGFDVKKRPKIKKHKLTRTRVTRSLNPSADKDL